jgi:hypothetical protein
MSCEATPGLMPRGAQRPWPVHPAKRASSANMTRSRRPRRAAARRAHLTARGKRLFKNYLRAARPLWDRNGLPLDCTRKGAAVTILVAHNPVKKPGPWVVARLRVVTPTGDPV